MPICVFKTDEVMRCIEHALNSSSWSMGWLEEEIPRPGLFFVHDQGVYLMSNGVPTDMDSEQTAYVAFAEHCNPRIDNDWWDNSRELVGGDDFSEVLPVNHDSLRKCGRYEEMHITIDGDEISWVFAKPRNIVLIR